VMLDDAVIPRRIIELRTVEDLSYENSEGKIVENITAGNKQLIVQCLNGYHNWVAEHIDRPVSDLLRLRPIELETIFREIPVLVHFISNLGGETPFNSLSEKDQSYLKRGILITIQTRSVHKEQKSENTNNPDIKERLEKEVQEIINLTTGEWFANVEPHKTPKLTDFITLQEATAHESVQLQERQYDEKFHILTAPELFTHDIRYFRSVCELRGRPITLAYLDIDDFKDFNTEHGHTKVDREVLPKFMSELEAHFYSHGHSYRFSGDEYVVLLSNIGCKLACQLLEQFQQALTQLDYFEVETGPTVSIGVMEIDAECHLTDNECLTMADKALGEAKAKRKGSIYVNKGSRPTDKSFEPYPNADKGE